MDELSTEYELMTTSQYDYLMKVVLVGNESAGKTTFFKQFINQTDITKYNPSVGVDVDYKVINTKNKTVNLQIWDTTPLPRYRNIMSSYYRRANIIIIFYDLIFHI
jgi:small GTP-binding protein